MADKLERARDSASPISSEDEDQEYIQGFKLVVVLTSLTLVYFLITLDNTILATAIPFITEEFHSLLDVGWYAGAYQLSSAALLPLTGKLYSQLNLKNIFLSCLLLFMVGSAICGAAQSSNMLIIGRAVAGMGGSGLLNGALIILNSCVPPQRQPVLMGILMALGQLGIAFGPLIGGAFTEYVSWRWCFYLNLPIGGSITVIIALIQIPDHLVKPSWRNVLGNAVTTFDLPGFALFAPAAIQVFLALQYGGNQFAWNSRQIIGLFCGSGVTFIVWLIWDYHQGDNAMVPFTMMKNRIVWASCICGSFLVSTLFISAYYLPIYFQLVRDRSPFNSGVDVLPGILTQMVFGVFAGAMIQKFSYYAPIMIVGAILNIIGCALTGLLSPGTPTANWAGYQVLFGAGRGLALSIPFLAVQNCLPKIQIPAAMSVLVFLQAFGAAVMIVLSQTIFINGLVELLPKYAPAIHPSTVINAGSTSLALVVPADSLGGVLLAYSKSLDRVFYFSAGMAAPPLLFGTFLGWQKVVGVAGAFGGM